MTVQTPDFPPLAFVDIETTGGNSDRDRITEVAIITLQDGQLFRWSRLINPGVFIPRNIQILTGIDPSLVENEPPFSEIAREIYEQAEQQLAARDNSLVQAAQVVRHWEHVAQVIAMKRDHCVLRSTRYVEKLIWEGR
jgi:DNA polymerase-3 subunit epsilon